METTDNLIHVSILLFVPLLIGLVTLLSNSIQQISFLLFPPLAAGTYTLFADPEGRYASPWKFVAGLTVGALCGWFAIEATAFLPPITPEHLGQPGNVTASGAALSVFLTAATTWLFDLEEPAAFSTALLVLVTGTSQLAYVLSVAVSCTFVAGGFVLWRREFYERRADFLFGTIRGDDHVLVPMRGDRAETTAFFAARIAAAHDAGKVILLDAATGTGSTNQAGGGLDVETTESHVERSAATLEVYADHIRSTLDVPCDVAVAQVSNPNDPQYVLEAARRTNCDLIVTPYAEANGRLAPFIRRLFRSNIDVVSVRLSGHRTSWTRILVPVRRPGDVAHAMLDFAQRLAGQRGTIAACHCIAREGDRRRAETMLANIVETFEGPIETRVAKAPIEAFLADNAANYDLAFIGASTDRTTASRFISPPTFQRIRDIDCDVAIVHRP